MSDSYIKGRRKSRVSKPAGIKMGKYLLPSNVAIPALMGFLFVVITVASAFEPEFDALVLRLTGFILFAGLAYAVRTRLKVMSVYVRLIDAFAALFAVTLLWSVAGYLHLYDQSTAAVSTPIIMAVLNLVMAVVLIAGVLLFEKDKPSTIFAGAGKLSAGLKIGVPVLIVGMVMAVILSYLLFDAGKADSGKLLSTLAMLALFSAAATAAGEAWFRGLFLARLLPVAGKQVGFIIQAVVFAFFLAGLYYLLTSSLLYAGGVLAVSAILGYVLAYVTVKHNSLIAAMLSGTGASMVMALPLFAAFLGA
ncbi:type II CAAX prenyl endopeptidase Rce1 family protein [Methanocella sp. MCL-LM]|uniref:CPBP family glutamic-type intramembrane protease n=1 Tax=Methanocella sp. MCL-LM TaxID=3412035 RepID=UPI003C738A2E